MANLYLREDLTADDFVVGRCLEVSGDEARHAVRVSRLRVGEDIAVGDGAGWVGRGIVEAIEKDRFAVRISAVAYEPEPEVRVILVQALAKGDRDERAVEQATEFGVDAVLPWEAERSVSRWGAEKRARGTEKWRRIAREAAKQSIRARVPEVSESISTAELCALAGTPGTEVLVLHPGGTERLSAWARGWAAGLPAETPAADSGIPGAPRRVLVVIGPEGGISAGEHTALVEAGAHTLVLGTYVLRTSSAGPAAIAILNQALGRW